MKVITGIFWEIEGKIYLEKKELEITKREEICGWVDYPGRHIDVWDKELQYLYPNDDFATYPRGRCMYSVKDKSYVIYADRCINQKTMIEIASLLGLKTGEYTVGRDTHYHCDKCEEDIF